MLKVLIIYDSLYGNTEKVAKAIGKSVLNSKVLHLSKVKKLDVEKADLLIIGSPTQGGRCTSDMEYFLENTKGLVNKKIAVFDTRLDFDDLNFLLKLLIKKLNYASVKMEQIIKSKSGNVVGEPLGLFVSGKEGPLKDGEIKNAIKWAKLIVNKTKTK